ncbi:hypothetical protein SARC_06225 [Sphaeroforma arctica JP610]|uniref:3-hydroxyanthranilate 3,4-dioxygenase n=1 Tax=Sphaeroforma arctica JP610 TaxID=667725 RepID=A0A0L0FY18_9EUKA|nr:hypothetical protein SARC_06225 [Sphaeroforma arctica JP610]KNC81456.1 hypothetical protein SARC_06225 [Sphaeroforma arctica JP610]|eukprot:XP_014155358.1 hypothetical protein SARC_06225 [Sphaeroforma arctica JP610]
MESVQNVEQWREDNKELFVPPVCNKLMHKKQLSIMFVGGPNTRTDFHLDESSEFFYQVKGNMELPTIQNGQRKVVRINEGQVFLLKSRVPHSPQRPETGSFGLVVERSREDDEMDGLRWYTDFEKCDEILWERYFHCGDLGRDLVPVVNDYTQSEQCRTGKPNAESIVSNPPLKQDFTTELPDPFMLSDWLEEHKAELAKGASLNLFPNHPDKEGNVRVEGGQAEFTREAVDYETWVYQLKGEVTVVLDGQDTTILAEGECGVIPSGKQPTYKRPEGSIGLTVQLNPKGNK